MYTPALTFDQAFFLRRTGEKNRTPDYSGTLSMRPPVGHKVAALNKEVLETREGFSLVHVAVGKMGGGRWWGTGSTVRYPSTDSSVQILIFQIHQIFNILCFLWEKNISFPRGPKINPKFRQNRQRVVMVVTMQI